MPISQGLGTLLHICRVIHRNRRYIAGNSTPCVNIVSVSGDIRYCCIERWYCLIEPRVFQCFMMFHNVLWVFHGVLLGVHDVLCVSWCITMFSMCFMMFHTCFTMFYDFSELRNDQHWHLHYLLSPIAAGICNNAAKVNPCLTRSWMETKVTLFPEDYFQGANARKSRPGAPI